MSSKINESTSALNLDANELSSLVTELYEGLLGRRPDEAGFRHYISELTSGASTLRHVVAAMASSDEFRARNGFTEDRQIRGCSYAEAMQVFTKFQRHAAPGRIGFITNFLGGLTATRFVGLESRSGVVEGYPIPRNFHAETLEWLGTLKAVQDARDTFRMIELGAGWAPWCTVGYIAASQRGLQPKVIAVDADIGHIRFIEESFESNKHNFNYCEVLHGIVGAEDSIASFPRSKDASRAYGSGAFFGRTNEGDDLQQFASSATANIDIANIDAIETLSCFSLAKLIDGHARIDLIHCDIQGAEVEVFEKSINHVSERVSRIIVGTHSFDIDRRLATLFPTHGWQLEGFDATQMSGVGDDLRTSADGTQVWKNVSL